MQTSPLSATLSTATHSLCSNKHWKENSKFQEEKKKKEFKFNSSNYLKSFEVEELYVPLLSFSSLNFKLAKCACDLKYSKEINFFQELCPPRPNPTSTSSSVFKSSFLNNIILCFVFILPWYFCSISKRDYNLFSQSFVVVSELQTFMLRCWMLNVFSQKWYILSSPHTLSKSINFHFFVLPKTHCTAAPQTASVVKRSYYGPNASRACFIDAECFTPLIHSFVWAELVFGLESCTLDARPLSCYFRFIWTLFTV